METKKEKENKKVLKILMLGDCLKHVRASLNFGSLLPAKIKLSYSTAMHFNSKICKKLSINFVSRC